MAEEKQTQIDDTLTQDDTDMLRAVLLSAHSRGIAPVSVYNQSEVLAFDEEAAA